MDKIKVIVVEDHPLAQEGLKAAIHNEEDMILCDIIDDAHKAYGFIKKYCPDVIILDLVLKGDSGWNLIQQLKSEDALPSTLILSVCDEKIYAKRLLKSGARGYLMKDTPMDEVMHAIRVIHEGFFHLSNEMTSKLIQESYCIDKAEKPSESDIETLSDRELQVFDMIGQGKRSQEIAYSLGVSAKTISTYKSRIMEKLKLSDSYALVHAAQKFVAPSLEGE